MKKSILLISALLCMLANINAAYFEKLPYTITQPDGKTINCFVTGDEYFNWIHDANGFTIIQAPDGYYYYGEQNGDLVQPSKYLVNSVDPASVGLNKWIKISKSEYERKRSAMLSYQTSISGPGYAPRTGTLNNIVVYIRFSDETEFTTIRQVYDDRLNPSTGVAIKSYFKEVSYDNLTISSTHYPACALTTNLSYQDSHPRSYFQPYNATTNPNGYTEANMTSREHQLLVDAINWININSPVSPSLIIDADGDGNVDNVCFIIRGSSGGWAELLWAHSWALYSQTVNINGKRVYGYTFQPENQVTVRTLCHEMFHALGSPDLYHYTNQGVITPAGYWDLMEYGSGHMLTYMKWKYTGNNWITSIPEITTTGTYTLNPITSSTNNCYKIASPYSTDQYFMVEYRNKSGTFETNVPGSGLIVYRIDTRVTGNASGPPDEVYVYRPNGTTIANGSPNDAFYSSTVGRTTINDITNPASFLQTGGFGGLNISNVTTAGTTISFNVAFPSSCTPPTIQASVFTSSAITNTTMTVGWTRGNGNSVLVVARKGSAVSFDPVNGSTYTANATFGSGTQLGEGNYVVYDGSSTYVNISGLNEGAAYYYAIYEYASGTYCYRKPALIGNASTIGYCAAGSPATAYEYISNVVIGSVNQSSGRGTAGYENYTSQVATMQVGVYSSATITVTNPYTTDQILIWVDWNKDYDFTDVGENVYASSGSFTTPHTTTAFTPPAGAMIGTTRMRIRLHDASSGPNSTPCGDSSYGEVEDYSINVITSAGIPVVTTVALTSITQTTAVSGGNITSDGGNTVNARGVCWATTASPNISSFKTSDGTGTGTFTSNLTGLSPATTYYLRAYATNSAGTAYGNEISFKTYNSDAIQDIEGNYYNIVTIGTQVWITENLKTAKYNDGTAIPFESGIPNTGTYSYYDNDISNKYIYGALYNWYAVATGKLCPADWYIPGVTDWNKLTTFLGGEYAAGGKMKEAGYIHWLAPNTGATNESGFTAMPGGQGITTFAYKGEYAHFWSGDEYETNNSWSYYLQLSYDNSWGGISGATVKEHGFSVRCLKNVSVDQAIYLNSGWNIMSFAAQPTDMSLKAIVNPLITAGTLTKIQDERGNAIEQLPAPIGWVDNIGLMKIEEGYKIKVTANTTLTVNGQQVVLPYTLALSTGWNIMGYPSMSSRGALATFNPLITATTLLKVQDEAGNAIEQLPAPIGWIDNIINLTPGHGYKVKTTANTTLTINSSGKGEFQNPEETTIPRPNHFKLAYTGNGLDQMNIYIKKPTVGGVGLKSGDEIGVFDGGLCVGAVVVTDPNQEYFVVIASLDDPTTKWADGFTEGNNFELRLWDNQAGLERKAQHMELEKGYSKTFEKLGTSVLAVDFETVIYTSLGDAFPNPSTDKTTFTFQLGKESKVRLEIFNIEGDLIKVLVDRNMAGGTHQIEWDNRSGEGIRTSSGVYFYRLKLDNFVQTKQLVIH